MAKYYENDGHELQDRWEKWEERVLLRGKEEVPVKTWLASGPASGPRTPGMYAKARHLAGQWLCLWSGNNPVKERLLKVNLARI